MIASCWRREVSGTEGSSSDVRVTHAATNLGSAAGQPWCEDRRAGNNTHNVHSTKGPFFPQSRHIHLFQLLPTQTMQGKPVFGPEFPAHHLPGQGLLRRCGRTGGKEIFGCSKGLGFMFSGYGFGLQQQGQHLNYMVIMIIIIKMLFHV